MGLDVLGRVRRATLLAGGLAALVTATYATPIGGLGLACGAAWSLVNFFLLETVVVALTTPGLRPRRAALAAGLALGGMGLLFAAGAWLLFHLPALWLVAGFSAPYLVIVFKALSRALIESRAWAGLVGSPWRAAAVVGALVVAAWWLMPPGSRGERVGAAPEARASVAAEASAGAGAAESATHGGGAAEGEEASGSQKFPNLITLIVSANHGAPWARVLHHYEAVIFAVFVGLLVCVTGFFASRRPSMIPHGLQNAAELLVEKLYDFVCGILGPRHGPRFFPLLGAIFVYILAMNLFGIVPLMDSPTSNLNVTFALGLTVFVYVQWIGIRSLGIVGYVDHLLGNPRTVTGWVLAPLMLPIHVLGELAKPISLSCRLFGNIFGEDMLMVGFATLGIGMLSSLHLPVGIPVHAIFFPLTLLTSVLQAFVFTVLTTIYILLMLPHEEEGHEGEPQHAH